MKYTTPHILFALLSLTLSSSALAQPIPDPVKTPSEPPAAEAPVLPAWCGVRPPMRVVMTYDRGKNFNAVTDRALVATEAFVKTLCPGDVVRVSEFGLKAEWLSDPIAISGTPAEVDKIVKIVRLRSRPAALSSVNELAVKDAVTWWEETLEEGQMPVLAVFTDTIESDAPRTTFVKDFHWHELPTYFQGRFLTVVTVLDRRSSRDAGTVYVTSTASAFPSPATLPSGGTTAYTDVMEAFIPPPEPVVVEPRVIIERVEVDNTPQWLQWLGTWQGSLTAGGAFFALGLLLFAAGRRSKRARTVEVPSREGAEHEPQQVTLLLRDNLRSQVLHTETRQLDHPLRVAPASNADFVIPGPYAFEIIGDLADVPVIRSANMLGIEVLREPDRRITLSEGETLPLRNGDRVNIGAGHMVEVQL